MITSAACARHGARRPSRRPCTSRTGQPRLADWQTALRLYQDIGVPEATVLRQRLNALATEPRAGVHSGIVSGFGFERYQCCAIDRVQPRLSRKVRHKGQRGGRLTGSSLIGVTTKRQQKQADGTY
jgi:hypothetical protein